ncbi:putative glycosyltransferase family 15 [Leptomonas pyrrhocoris]|uniref:Putative glycosyltransferase family 15 n=1 Tax=Leptomonas pyrrhocoris TaxID=157538 RepID=A0A0N0DRN8_LEPPY|nr:putative glycosyltransferase family 15 [Leptomonas pyrrhocoris]XP_015653347.1 putative glycosyltransferase family 15 [Leptomonas pyrrhocoris]XP_015653350.1 putative glycosyltransferase family 15 [Leptomonas pyrrhocoris]XP_015653351.1 putative glycosyltransferase family 15 [Leptomonas pyrrhocoris]KPA74907.1 putative glycosyltransferase family 15 [Leptomonas pyrrhocoris]KPA74908.1 putative glycosyltransferase family 15 [Leptomonas pyrrhocoris]KPA74911.1 putative glycosyltransferase family 15|eukprot:XP_015653346.1 putative glycosyltransferase family 15 [Leptomonas pyrrhocoris]
MKPAKVNMHGALPSNAEDVPDNDATLLRRLSCDNGSNEAENSSKAEIADVPTEHDGTERDAYRSLLPVTCLQLLRTVTHRWCPSWLLSTGTAAAQSVSKAHHRCCSDLSQLPPNKTRMRRRHLGVLLGSCACAVRATKLGCLRLLHCVRHGCRSPRPSSPEPPQPRAPRRSDPVHRCRRRAAFAASGSFLLLCLAALVDLIWVANTLSNDPYTALRIELRVAYPAKVADDVVRIVKRRESGPLGHTPAVGVFSTRAQTIHAYVEERTVSLLASLYAQRHPNEMRAARARVASLQGKMDCPTPPMLGEYAPRRIDSLISDAMLSRIARDGVAVGACTLEVASSALLRCTHGVPTLAAPRHDAGASPSTTDAIFDSLWAAFANASRAAPTPPGCLARRQNRMPCADVGTAADSRPAMTVGVPPDERSRVRFLYEHGRVGVDGGAVAELYYDYTPGLPAEAREWRVQTLRMGRATDADRFHAHARAQEERFRRTTPRGAVDPASPPSAVILFLAGAAERGPRRRNEFMLHALPLLEKHLLQIYPHYPVHVFYEMKMPSPAWSLTDVYRHSDVYTILHSWQPPDATAPTQATQHVRIPPPPPVLVDAADKLRVLRAQQAAARSWFEDVASRVPSAPYVTFENVGPLFSTLPCGVTEDDVSVWAKGRSSRYGHRRGYRQMCRFWAQLVWRLPSLRISTGSAEGLREVAALPPWRFRYAYYLRLDTDSFLHRPVACDPFATMMAQRCAYGYNAIVLDEKFVTEHLGSAIAEWIGNRTSIGGVERALAGVNATGGAGEVRGWGRLGDPAASSMVTLVSAAAREELPPLPPTWPWPNVFPEHSSAALSAAEKDVLRTQFFTEEPPDGRRAASGPLRAEESPVSASYTPLPAGFATQSTYNRRMYFNNFELGTFALKAHPLYTSLVDFVDNRDYDDVTGPAREAASFDYTLKLLRPDDAEGVVVGGNASVYATPVYLLLRASESASPGAPATNGSSSPCLGRRLNGRVGADPDMKLKARDIDRDWRSGYFQHRWGDAPVHSVGVEAVMQREGWAACAFASDFGLYQHGQFRPASARV